MNIVRHCIASTPKGLGDDGTCFPNAGMTPYRYIQDNFNGSATDEGGINDSEECGEEFSANFQL